MGFTEIIQEVSFHKRMVEQAWADRHRVVCFFKNSEKISCRAMRYIHSVHFLPSINDPDFDYFVILEVKDGKKIEHEFHKAR